MKSKITPFRSWILLPMLSLLLGSVVSSQAVDRFWTAGTDTYNNAANWGGTIPNGVDNAIVNNGGTVLINATDPAWTTFDARAGQGGGNGAYIQNGSTVTLNSWFRLGVDPGTVGSYTLNAGTLNANPAFHVGETGTGLLTINGGILNHFNSDAIIIGDRGGSTTTFGKVVQTNGVLNSNSEIWVGQGGAFGDTQAGEYDLGGTGVINVNNWLAIGRANANGVFNMTNGLIVKAGGGNIIVGSLAGNGTFNQFGGTVINTNTGTWLGEAGGGVGTWNLSGGVVNASTILLSINNGGSGDGIINLSGTGLLIASEITSNGIGNSIVNLNGGVLQAGADNTTFIHDLTALNVMAGGATIDSAGHAITIIQPLVDAGGGGGVTKIGAGSVTLAGPNTYTGPSIVKAGKLIVGTASLVTSAVVVSNTAGFGVNVGTANAQANPGSVTLAGPATSLDFVLNSFGNPSFAPLNVTGLFTANGTITVNINDTLPQVGEFPLVKYASRTGPGVFVLGSLPVGVSAAIVTNVGNSSIDLNITSTALIRWDGEVAGGIWDINTTTNWNDFSTSLPAKYTEGAAVFFDDLARGTTTVSLGVTVNPGTIVVTNDNLPYTLTGAGKINGATSLTKQGTNTFTIANTTLNTYSGATVVSGGILSVNSLANGGQPSSIGNSTSDPANLVLDGGELSYTGPATTIDRGYSIKHNSILDLQNDLTVNGVLNPSLNATFGKSGPGTLAFKKPGVNSLTLGGGGGAFNVLNGNLVLDGSNGGQTNTMNGEMWLGGSTNSGGNLVVTNSTLVMSSWFAIARGSGTSGYVSSANVWNSTLQIGAFSMGFDNGIAGTLETALLTLNNSSTLTNTGDSNIAESTGAQANFTLKDSSVFFSNNRTMVGWHNNATGSVTVANSARVIVNAWLSIGNEGGVGTFVVKDNGSLTLPGGSSDLNICDVNGGIGTLMVTNSALVRANFLYVGKGTSSSGTYIQAGGRFTAANGDGANIVLGNGGGSSGTFNLNGGTFAARQVSGIGGATTTFNFNGGILQAGNTAMDVGFMPALISSANIQLGGAIIDTSTNDITIDQPLVGDFAGDGGLTKQGVSRLALNGFNTYTNTTLVSAGSLGGNGTISGPVLIQPSATLAPGTGIGTLTINNNLTIAGNVAVDVDRSASPSNDLVVVSGSLNNTGTGTVKVNNLGPTLQVGDSFTLFSKPVVNGNALSVVAGGAIWTNKLAIDGSIQVVAIAVPPVFSPGGVARLPSGNISITATGAIGATYKLWASPNVTLRPITNTWTLLSSGTVSSTPFTIQDLTATNFSSRFYIFSSP